MLFEVFVESGPLFFALSEMLDENLGVEGECSL